MRLNPASGESCFCNIMEALVRMSQLRTWTFTLPFCIASKDIQIHHLMWELGISPIRTHMKTGLAHSAENQDFVYLQGWSIF